MPLTPGYNHFSLVNTWKKLITVFYTIVFLCGESGLVVKIFVATHFEFFYVRRKWCRISLKCKFFFSLLILTLIFNIILIICLK